MSQDYTYYAIISDGEPKETPSAVVRELVDDTGHSWAEIYTRDLEWKATSWLTAIRAGRRDDDAEVITEDVVERFIARVIARNRAEQDQQG